MPSVEEVLDQLKDKDSRSQELLSRWQTEGHQALWTQDPRLYRAFAKKLIQQGHPAHGLDLACKGLVCHKNDRELQYLEILALARGGNIAKAETKIQTLLQATDIEPKLRAEVFSLEGRLWKDRYMRARDFAQRQEWARRSAEAYKKAANLPEADSFPWINWATMTLLADDPRKAKELAQTTMAKAEQELKEPGRDEDYWILATLAEACMLLGDFRQAGNWYLQALKQANAQNDHGAIASMRRNPLLIREKIQGDDQLEHMFDRMAGVLVVFAGHMLDHPERAVREGLPPRFPHEPELIAQVERTIRTFLDEADDPDNPTPKLGFSSATCGSDILFAEQLLKDQNVRELHIVLPFALNDFYETSVNFSGAPEWRERCDQILKHKACQIHYATEEPYLNDDVLFDFVNSYMQGVAILRARQRGIRPQALVVIDAEAPTTQAQTNRGAGFFMKTWERTGHHLKPINLNELRAELQSRMLAAMSSSPSASPSAGASASESASDSSLTISTTRREIKAMLFADLKEFSKLPENYTPQFFKRYPRFLANVLKSLESKPFVQNTWGDGLHLVFDRVADCAEGALRLLEEAEKIDWRELGFSESSSPMRIGVHAGPVYRVDKDPVTGKPNCFGRHVTRAARIEPVTTPGCVFASEQFAALVTVEADDDYVCEYLGIEDLHKGYGKCPLYRLTRRWL